MTVWEMERKSGLERSNIRFYEKEGLLNPQRRENGYREYTEEDLQELLRIKLMRRLGFSIESIRALQEGSTAMEEALSQRLRALQTDRRLLNATEQVCMEMRQDGVSFASLDAQRYLSSFDRALNTTSTPALRPSVPAGDTVKPPRIPWRRYFARWLDLQIVGLIIYAFLFVVCKVNVARIPNIVDWITSFMGWIVLIPLEALCLSKLRTTPGKALMGITVTDWEERPLTFGRAAERAWQAFWRGAGLTIPIYGLIRLWKSYKAVRDLEGTEWDTYLTVSAKEYKHWRTVVYIAAFVILNTLMVLFALTPMMPDNRGDDLTVAEFVENYNRLSDFHNLEGAGELQEDGTFLTKPTVIYYGGPTTEVNRNICMEFETEGDVLVGISFTGTDGTAFAGWAVDREGKEVLQLAVMSWVWADTNLFKALGTADILDEFIAHNEGTLEREMLGHQLVYSITSANESETLWEYTYDVSFRMSKLP